MSLLSLLQDSIWVAGFALPNRDLHPARNAKLLGAHSILFKIVISLTDLFCFVVTAQRIFEILKNTVIPERSYRESRNRLKLSSGFPLKILGNDRIIYIR